MPHDGTNHPWYQGFTDMFGGNAMQPQQTIGTPNNDYYNYLTQSLNVGLSKGDKGYMSVEDALLSKDPAVYAKLQVADLQYDPESKEGQGMMNKVMNDPVFMMGLSLMNQAASGKSVQEALMPAMTQTQAFITNQELRRQNKMLARDKTTKRITEVISDQQALQSGDQALTMAGLQIDNQRDKNVMSGIDAQFYMDEKGINLDMLKTNRDLGKVSLEQQEIILKYADKNAAIAYELAELGLDMTKIDANMYATEKEVNLRKAIADADGSETQNDILRVTAKYAEPNAALDLITKELKNENIDASTKSVLAQTKDQILNTEIKEYDFKNEQEKDRLFKEDIAQLVATETISKTEASKIIQNGRENWTGTAGLTANEEEIAAVRAFMDDYGRSWYDSLPIVGMSDKDFETSRMMLDQEMVRTVKKLSSDGSFDKTLIPKAQKILQTNGFIKKNETWKQLFLFKSATEPGYFLKGDLEGGAMNFPVEPRAMGGQVQAGKPYVVGEQGPEIMVPNQSGNIVSNPSTPGGYTWENAIIDNSPELSKIANSSGLNEAKKALKKFRPDLYV